MRRAGWAESDYPVEVDYRKIAADAAIAFGFEQNYESEQLAYFGEALAGTNRFIDVGANRGLYAYIANLVMKNGYIALIEANPTLVKTLRRNVPTWPRQNGNTVEVFGIAAGDIPTISPFFIGELDTLGTLIDKNDLRNGPDAVAVACEPLDKIFHPVDRTLIKIDVEGFEYRVILGAKKLLAGGTRVFVELHGWGDPERGKYPLHVLYLMSGLGFAVRRIGASYAYDFQRAGPTQRSLSFVRWAPLLAAKYLIRRSGLRPAIYHMLKLGPDSAS